MDDPAGEEESSFSLALYSSDDDEEDHAYIELELGGQDDIDELRISFSAVNVPFPGFFVPANSAIIHHVELDDKPAAAVLLDSMKGFTNRRFIAGGTKTSHYPQINAASCIVPASRKAPAAVNGGGMTKLLVKLRSIIISGFGSMRPSMAQAAIAQPNGRWRLTSIKPFERWLALCKPTEPVAAVRTNVGGRSSLKVRDMKFETMRKLFGSAVSKIKNNGSKSNRMNKSCPTSVKSSPVHHQLGDASLVYAAIAHCKKSFAQTDDFSF